MKSFFAGFRTQDDSAAAWVLVGNAQVYEYLGDTIDRDGADIEFVRSVDPVADIVG